MTRRRAVLGMALDHAPRVPLHEQVYEMIRTAVQMGGITASEVCLGSDSWATRYSYHGGAGALQRELAGYLVRTRGVVCEPEQIVLEPGTAAAVSDLYQLFDCVALSQGVPLWASRRFGLRRPDSDPPSSRSLEPLPSHGSHGFQTVRINYSKTVHCEKDS